jgi:ppGpp synthetase/RelA/SpoT-type nucleotidyltranferase
LAGLRVVVHGTRADQDEIAARIGALFSDGDRQPKLIDRRADPRAGYRAVHLEVRREGILIEVQVRTNLQHRWAELFERAADRLGRELRYGEQFVVSPEAESLIRALEETSFMINTVEEDALSTDPLVQEAAIALPTRIVATLALFAEYLKELP